MVFCRDMIQAVHCAGQEYAFEVAGAVPGTASWDLRALNCVHYSWSTNDMVRYLLQRASSVSCACEEPPRRPDKL